LALPKGNQNIRNDGLKKEYIQKLSKIIESNDQSFYMLYGINQARGFLSLEEINFLISKLSYKINDFPTGRKLSIILKNSKNSEVNNHVPNFNFKDINGNIFTLSSIKSKIILIDFWATWCVPCLKQIEELKNIYSKYKNRSFEIVSISIDDDSKVWASRSKKLKIPWINLIGDSLVKYTYNLTFIPQNLLVNQNGLILKKNLSVTEIDEQLISLLKPR